jgi:hypothetical protein
MGLDITAYSKLTRVADERPDDYPDNQVWLWSNPAFPGREEGAPTGLYQFETHRKHFSIGYGSYMHWRTSLASMVGYDPKPYWDCKLPEDDSKPFMKLIFFSDCEGTIGPVVAAQLAREFDEYAGKAETWAGVGATFYTFYCNMREAMHMASDGGAVKFA